MSHGAVELPTTNHDLARVLNSVDLSNERAVTERVIDVALALLFASGLKGLNSIRTLEIAKLARTTESTMFRYFPNRESILESAIEQAWQAINTSIGEHAFARPLGAAPGDVILADVEAMLQMFNQPVARIRATGAFLSFRRPSRLTYERPPSQTRYERRLALLCDAHLEQVQNEPSAAGEQLATFITNYVASVWFTWLAYMDDFLAEDFLLNPSYVLNALKTQLAGLLETQDAEDTVIRDRPAHAPL